MTYRALIGSIALFLFCTTSFAGDWKDALVRQGIIKFGQLEARNKLNDVNGSSHLNEYVIELDPNWIEERPDRQILSEKYESLSSILSAFNNNRNDALRFYVIVVNNYEAQLDETVDFSSGLPARIENLSDYLKSPTTDTQYETFRKEIASIPAEIMAAMDDRYAEQIVYFYGRIKLWKLHGAINYRYDALLPRGGRLEHVGSEIISKSKSGLSGDAGAEITIEKVIFNVINAVQLVIDGEGAGTPVVNCNQSLSDIVANTAETKQKNYESAVDGLANLLDAPQAHNKIGGSRYFLFDSPEDLPTNDLFNQVVLPDRLDLLAAHSNFKLYIIFSEVRFGLKPEDWPVMAEDVYEKSSVAKTEPNTIVIVVPYLKTLCQGSNWLGLTVATGTGLIMPSAFIAGNETLTKKINSALSMHETTWEAGIRQALTHIPKKHYLFRYAVSYDLITKRYAPVITDGPGHDEIFDLEILVDSRLQTYVDARAAIEGQLKLKVQTPGILEPNQRTLRELPGKAASPYRLKHGLKESILAKISGQGENAFTSEGEKFVRWFVSGKMAEAEASTLATLAYQFDGDVDSPDDYAFVAGVNPVVLESYFTALDAVGMILNFAELDWITDGAGFLVASYYSDTQNKIIYGASLAIPVSAIVIKAVAKRARMLKKTLGGEWELVEEVDGSDISKRFLKSLSSEELLKIVQEGSTLITEKSIIIKTLDAAAANQQFTGQQIKRFGMSIDLNKVNPPHADIPGIGVNDFQLLEPKYFVRVSNSGNNPAGEWLITLEDFKAFRSPGDIKNGLALPTEPTHYNVVRIPEGIVIRESQAAKVWQEGAYWGNGGTKQYQIQAWHSMKKNTTDTWFSASDNLSNLY